MVNVGYTPCFVSGMFGTNTTRSTGHSFWMFLKQELVLKIDDQENACVIMKVDYITEEQSA